MCPGQICSYNLYLTTLSFGGRVHVRKEWNIQMEGINCVRKGNSSDEGSEKNLKERKQRQRDKESHWEIMKQSHMLWKNWTRIGILQCLYKSQTKTCPWKPAPWKPLPMSKAPLSPLEWLSLNQICVNSLQVWGQVPQEIIISADKNIVFYEEKLIKSK